MALLALRYVPRVGARTLEAIAIASLAGIVFSVVFLHEGRIQPLGLASLVPTLSTVGLILTGAAAQQTLVARALSTSGMRLLGRLSYSWYLWHWPVLVYMHATMRAPTLATSLGFALLSLVPAAAMYAWIESPIRHSTYLKQRPRFAVVGAVLLATLTYGAATAAIVRANTLLHSPPIVKILAATANPRTYADGCQVALLKIDPPACEYGPATNDTTIVLFGDSHAAHWFSTFDSVAKMRGWKYVNWTKTKCPAALLHVQAQGRVYFECEEWKENIIERILKLRPTIVVVSNDKTYRVLEGNEQMLVDSSAIGRVEWTKGVTAILRRLQPSGAKLVLLADTPQPQSRHSAVPRATSRRPLSLRRVGGRRVESGTHRDGARHCALCAGCLLHQPERVPLRHTRGAATSPDGMVRYQDSNHLSVICAATLAPQLSQALTAAVQESP